MPDLSTTYMGLRLKNPLVAGSSGLTGTVDGLKKLEAGGAAAVVLKSIFEEEIAAEYDDAVSRAARKGMSLESYDYYDYEVRGAHVAQYVELVRQARSAVSIPVIASVNCTWSHEWVSFARDLEQAGAHGLELNMFFLPSDLSRSSAESEEAYLSVVDRVLKQVKIPVALKISPSFSNLAQMIGRLSKTGVAGLVLFNRFYSVDFDIDAMTVTGSGTLSSPAEAAGPLRWIALMARRVSCDLAASTGVHDGAGLIKMLLAGARAVQAASCFYLHGPGCAAAMLAELSAWMDRHGFSTLADFRGRLSQAESVNPGVYERVQYMKHYAGGQA
ncbi:MAG TPA: dihydroorotate dehydrogenase-like protein [Spirochaetia bacterium]|nr:dihydroorotate dehydrogenase-like protein [Spirochaetia bacterium]